MRFFYDLRPRTRGRCAIVALFATAGVTACTTAKASDAGDDAPHVRVQTTGDSSIVSVSHPERFTVVPVTRANVADEVRTTGVVGPDVTRTVPVNALGSGRVVSILAKLGDDVHQGQPLLVISSTDAGSALSDYEKNRLDVELARKQLERAQVLYEHGTIAKKDLEIAEEGAQKAAVDMRTSSTRVRLLGANVARPGGLIELTAPISGTIVEQNVTQASGVKSPDNSPNLFTIADLSVVWVMCDVYENDLGRVHINSGAQIRLKAFPERVFDGRVGDISKVLDPATRAARVRVALANPDAIMRQGMFASVTLTSATRQSRLVVPATALLRLHDADWLFLKGDAGTFRRVRVEAGGALPDGLQVVSGGVAEGDLIVRDALQLSRVTEQ